MTTVLMVCVGNICRSPLAERLLQARAGDQLSVSSAGVDALAGHSMDALASAELVRLGGDPDGFRARQLTPPMVAQADLVLTATKQVRTQVLGIAPAGMRRTFTLTEFAALCGELELPSHGTVDAEWIGTAARLRGRVAGQDLDITDPYGQDAAAHHAAATQVAAAVDVATDALTCRV